MKKNILIIVLFISGIITSFAQETYTVTVNFTGMDNDKGKLMVAIYNSENTFLRKGYKGSVAAIKDKKATVIFKDIPKGVYAVSCFHDENNNKKMDTRIFGIPKEAYGASNDAKGFMGPPKYEDAKFNVTEDKTLTIKVN